MTGVIVFALRSATNVAWLAGPLVLLAYAVGAFLSRQRSEMQALGALAATTAAWHVTVAVAPPATKSAIAVFASQGLTVWQSVALWVGLAVVVGVMAPPWNSFRGGDGLAPTMAILLVYAPTVFGAAIAGWFGGMIATGGQRRALPAALATAVTYEWLAWIFDARHGWGAVNGPELSLWTAVTAGVLFAGYVVRRQMP